MFGLGKQKCTNLNMKVQISFIIDQYVHFEIRFCTNLNQAINFTAQAVFECNSNSNCVSCSGRARLQKLRGQGGQNAPQNWNFWVLLHF